MWRGGKRGDKSVTCIACGESVPRRDAREYDKLGDRWDRRGKEFEHLCKPCHRDLCHQSRDGLESLLVRIGAGVGSRDEFLAAFADAVRDREPDAERESGSDR